MIIFRFIKRNILMYIRDRSTVFFSMLSSIIVLALMVSFLGYANVESTLDAIGNNSGIAKDTVKNLIVIWTISGILVVNSVSITMTMVGFMVKDDQDNKLCAFFVAPVNRIVYIIGYVIAANIVAFLMCVATLVIAEIYIVLSGGEVITMLCFFKVLGLILLNVFSASAFVFLCATCIHSISAFNGLSTIVGTLVGFLAAIYIPYGSMPAFLQKVIKFVPLYHGASALREVYTERLVNKLFTGGSAEIKSGYCEFMGMTIIIGGYEINLFEKCLFLFLTGVLFIALSSLVLRKKTLSER